MSAGRIEFDTLLNTSGFSKGTKSLGKIAAVGLAAVAGAVTAIVTASVKGYAEYEQLVGGVETLFKDSADLVMQYADNAYKTAGLSANQYMAQVTAFSASLLQSLEGDSAAAARVADMAVTDMADNANKMGTSMEAIQNAYQGFAKQNYTMLDNLKLGYGGTKTEMARLLADAEKLTGVKYDINNLSDVFEAIHAIQEELGITGTTALEAATTIQGSAASMKAAWTNLLVGMSDDTQDFDALLVNFIDSIGAFASNLIPRIEIALGGIVQLIQGLGPQIVQAIPSLVASVLPSLAGAISSMISAVADIFPSLITSILNTIPQFIQAGIDSILGLAQGLTSAIPQLIPVIVQAILSIVQTIYESAPELIQAGLEIVMGLVQGILNAIPVLVSMIPQIIESLLNYIIEALPMILEMGVEILLALVDGVITAIPQLISMLPTIINTIVTTLLSNLPYLIQTGIDLLLSLIMGIVEALPDLIAMLPEIINTIVTTLIDNLPLIIQAGIEILIAVISGIVKAIPQLVSMLPKIITAIVDGLGALISGIWEAGKNLVQGLWEGIKNAAGWLMGKIKEWCGSILDGIKSFFGIHSPSTLIRDEIGKMLPPGISIGVTAAMPKAIDDIESELDHMNARIQGTINAQQLELAYAAAPTPGSVVPESQDGSRFYFKQENHSPKALSPSEMTQEGENFVERMKWKLF